MAKISEYFTGRPAKNRRPSLCDARRYEFSELEKATNKFTSLIRPGAYGDLGSVYKVKISCPLNYLKFYNFIVSVCLYIYIHAFFDASYI